MNDPHEDDSPYEFLCDRCEDRRWVVTLRGDSLTFRPCPKCNNDTPEDAA